jgi:uncharacterized membrane protein
MTWLTRNRLRAFVRSSVWLVPLGGILLALILAPVVRGLDAVTGWTLLNYTSNGARTLLGALVASALSFVVFTFSILLVAVQMSSTNLSPRVIMSFLEDRPVRMVLGSFVFTYAYAAAVLGRIEETVPQLSMLLALLSSLVSIVAFIYLIDHSAKSMRPVAVVERVALEGQRAIECVYPHALPGPDEAASGPTDLPLGPLARAITHDRISAVLQAMDIQGLVAAAERDDCVLKLVPQIGEFVAKGEPLFRAFGGRGILDEGELRQTVAFGSARTMEQDPIFALRILVDVAAKALSPAVNDPTTAVVAIHQIHRLLRRIGTRDLSTGRVHDRAGRLRLVYRTPDWEDFVRLAVTEIRLYGVGNIQVPRRLRAMLESLIEVLPPSRTTALREELSLLERSVQRGFQDLEDQVFAGIADSQGVGGAR